MMRRISRALAALLCALLVVACGGGGIDDSPVTPPGPDCGNTRLKQFVLDTSQSWYLFPELLPASINQAAYATPAELLDALTATARAEGKDRFFSGITGIAAENALLQGQTAGFGFTLLTRGSAVFLGQVFENSAASEAGFARGDELLAIGTTTSNLVPIATILASSGGLNEAIGPSTPGLARVIRWRSLAGTVSEKTVTKRSFEINPVPASGVRVLTLADGRRVGHLTFRSFVADPAASGQAANLAALRNAFAQFGAQGVRDVIVDLRYNGGGLVSIAELLMNLIAGDREGQVSFATRLNPTKTSQQETARFVRQSQTLPTQRIAFITTGASASASELVANSMVSYLPTAVVGTRSFGKPVGQFAFDVAECDFRLRLVTFKSVNREGNGDYFLGLPYAAFTNTGGRACAASDDLTRAPGDPLEGMTAAALGWLGSPTGACPSGTIAGGGGDIAALQAPLEAPEPAELLQYYLPGTY
jgi:C-terminal processing protease CtpA/Prc